MTDVRRRVSPARGIAGAAVLLAGVTVLARAAGFGRVLVFAHTVGPSCLGDTYFTANTVPNILFDVVAGGALSSIAVPILAGRVDAGDDAASDRIASALLSWTLVLVVPVLVLGILLVHPIINLLIGSGHPGCSPPDERAVGARMLLVFLPQVLLYGVAVVSVGVLQAHRRFLGPAIAPLISSLVVAGAYLLFAAESDRRETHLSTLTRGHELILSVGTTLGVLALVLTLLVPLARSGRRLRPALRFPPGVAATARRMALAGAVVLGSQDLATVAILRLANDRGASGAVVLYNLAWTVFLLPWAILAVPLATASFPTLTARWQAGDRDSYAATLARASRAVVLTTAGAAAVMVATSRPAARVVVLGAPGGVPPDVLARALVTFAPGLIGFGLVALLSRAHYARGDARTPALATASGWLLAVVVDIVLVTAMPRDWTAAALGIGTTVGMSAAGAWLAVSLHPGAGHAHVAGVRRTALACFGAGALAGLGAFGVARALPRAGVAGSAVLTVLVATVCVGIYAGVIAAVDPSTLRLVKRWPRKAQDISTSA